MTISELSVRRPVLMTMVYVMLIVIAILFIPRLDQAMFPDMDLPYVTVFAECGDADPESIELQVAKRLEDAVSSVENLNKMTSYSQNGLCYLVLEFNYGTDLDDAVNDINSMISMVNRTLPDWVSSVNVFQLNSFMSSGSVLTLSVSGPYSIPELKGIAENTIDPLLSRVEGVGRVTVTGGGDIEYHILLDPNRVEAYGLSTASVISSLAATNVIGSGGEITDGNYDFSVRTDNRYKTEDDIKNTLVTLKGSTPVYIKDVANVVRTTESGVSESFLDGEPIVSISVYKTSDSSITQTAKKVKAQLDTIRASVPSDVQVVVRRDSSKMINETLNEVYSSAVSGVLLAALVIFLFLRGIRPTIIISLSMPICILFTLMLMSICGISINMISMSGLILGIGMIVDASIIILENTIRYRQLGESAPASAILGSKNMFAAIFASTLTTICVFLPEIIYMNDLEMFGQMLKDLIFTVCFSLLCSLFVAVTLVPALAGSILRVDTTTQRPRKGWFKKFDDACTKFQNNMDNGYARSLGFFLDRKLFFFVPLLALFIFSLSLFSHLGFQLMPNNAQGDELTLSLTLDEGITQEVTKKYVFDMQDKIEKTFPEGSWENIISRVEDNEGSISISLPELSKQKRGQDAVSLREMIRPYLTEDPSASWTYSSGQRMSSSSAIDIELSSDNIDFAYSTAKEVENLLHSVSSLTNVENSLTSGRPQLDVVIDKDRATSLGVTATTISSLLATSVSGSKATEISTMSTSDTYDVKVKLDEAYLASRTDLAALLVPTSAGLVRLDTIADIVETTAPTTIQRENKKRINHVTADTIEGVSTSVALSEVQEILSSRLTLPDDVTLNYAGEMADFSKYQSTFMIVIVMALLLVYVVMAAQFESLLNPFIVFCTIPLLLIGVIIIHAVSGSSFSIMSIVGIVALIGVVVNNGIVLVDAISREIRENRTPVRDACLISAKNRLRPILMTTLTTVLGMIPMAFFPGSGARMMQPIALTFVGGIITGAFLTLYLSPLLYMIFNKRKEKDYDNPNTLENQLRAFDLDQSKRVLKDL